MTEWRQRSAAGAKSVDNMEKPTLSRDAEPTIPPVSNKFKQKTVSITSRMMALSRGESLSHQILQEGDENVWQTRSLAANRDVIAPS